jgi:hypothetical protein
VETTNKTSKKNQIYLSKNVKFDHASWFPTDWLLTYQAFIIGSGMGRRVTL